MSHLYAIAAGSASLLVGLSVAIVALLLISLLLQLFPRLTDRSGRRTSPVPAVLAPEAVPPSGSGEADLQLAAVITAALAAYLSAGEATSSIPAAGFRVRRIRRIR